jgi:hypothetical protein
MSRLTRRSALLAGAGAVSTLSLALTTRATATSRTDHAAQTPHPARPDGIASAAQAPAAFDEVLQGRRIQGAPDPHAGHGGGHGAGHHSAGYSVRVDGRELHLMRNADGTWISVVNHYETFATPRALARAAVTELQGAVLVPIQTA